MTVSEFIDEIVGYSDNVNPAGADYADRRQRILYWLIREASQVYYHREWPWRLKPSDPDVVIPADQGWGPLPADYLSLGKLGHVYNMSQNGAPVEPATESEITDLLAMNSQVVNSAIYAIYGTDDSVDPPHRKIWMTLSPSDITLRLSYHPKMPTLDESTNNANLNDACPIEYQETVLIPGVASRAKRSKSDARWKDDLAERMDGLKNMVKNCRRFQGGQQQMPSFFGS